MSDNKTNEEQRKFPRRSIDVKVNYSDNAIATSKNISEGGICLITEEKLEEGSILTLVFYLPGEDEIKTYGKVKWSRQSTEHLWENGIEFWDINKTYRVKIKEYLDNDIKTKTI